MTIKSPFHIIENFVSPLMCEKFIAENGITTPSFKDEECTIPFKHVKIIQDNEFVNYLQENLQEHLPDLEQRYEANINGMASPIFQQYFEDPKTPAELHGCENAKFSRKKWVKFKDVDLVCYLWLKEWCGGVPLDPRTEVYGGKLEFPAYDFSLLPQRGTLVIFPAGPHFITAISPILVGSLEVVKFSIKLTQNEDGIWLYQPQNFPGSYKEWFSEDNV